MGTGAIQPEMILRDSLPENQSLLCIDPSEELSDSFPAGFFNDKVERACVILNDNFSIGEYHTFGTTSDGNPDYVSNSVFCFDIGETIKPFNFLSGDKPCHAYIRNILAEYLIYEGISFALNLPKKSLSFYLKGALTLLDLLITE